MEKEQVKKWLCRFSEMMREMEITEERYITIKQKSVSVSAPSLEGMPHGTGTITDKTANYIVQLEEIESRYRQQNKEAFAIYDEIEAKIRQIKGKNYPDERAVLRMRYLDLFKWCEVSEVLFARNHEDYYEREDSFLRRTCLIHDRALEKMAALLPELEMEERENEHCKI